MVLVFTFLMRLLLLLALQIKVLKFLKTIGGPTTGKHLNAIDGGNKNSRVDQDEFDDFVESLEITKVLKHVFK